MAYVLGKTQEDLNDDYTQKEFTHPATGIKVTIISFANPKYQRAYDRIRMREQAYVKDLYDAKLDDEFLSAASDEGMTTNELWLRAIAMFLIADWQIVDAKKEPVPVTADNFILLLTDLDDPQDFARWCVNCATEIAIEKDKAAEDIKKKLLTATTGKSSTAAKTKATAKSTNT